jgi:hypothetical protein
MDTGNVWWDGNGVNPKYDAAFRERWRTTLDPAWRLPQSKAAIGWFTGTNDNFFWMPALMDSYAKVGRQKHLTIIPNWNHGLPSELDDQVFGWLDVNLQGKPPFIAVSPLQIVKRDNRLFAHWAFTPVAERPVKAAELMLSFGEKGNWLSRCWKTLPVTITGQQCEVELPVTTVPYYIGGTILDQQQYRYSTPLVRVNPTEFGLDGVNGKPDYDGCAEWGDFEPNQARWQQGIARINLTTDGDAHTGTQAVRLKSGATSLYPIYFTAGMAHRFTCYLKAPVPVAVVIKLNGKFDGKPMTVEKSVTVGPAWTETTLDITLPDVLYGNLIPQVIVPKDAEVLLDTVTFHPRD